MRPLRRVLAVACASLVGVTLAGGVASAASAAQASPAAQAQTSQTQPTATAEFTNVVEGQFVRVSGTGWGPPGPLVSVQVCGNAGINQSADCDLAGTASVGIRDGGVFYSGVTVHVPPKACPCVLRVYSTARGGDIRLPITIQGVPNAPLEGAVGLDRRVLVSNVSVAGSGPFISWFGAAPSRELVFTVTNTGNTLLHNPNVTLAWGKGTSPTGFMAPPKLGDLAPGQVTVVRVAIPINALSFGTYRVTVNANPVGGETTSGFAETTIVPWGLVLLFVILLQVLLIVARNRYRRRQAAKAEGSADGDGGPGDGGDPGGGGGGGDPGTAGTNGAGPEAAAHGESGKVDAEAAAGVPATATATPSASAASASVTQPISSARPLDPTGTP